MLESPPISAAALAGETKQSANIISDVTDEEKVAIVKYHNDIRRNQSQDKPDTGPNIAHDMKWDDNLAKDAQGSTGERCNSTFFGSTGKLTSIYSLKYAKQAFPKLLFIKITESFENNTAWVNGYGKNLAWNLSEKNWNQTIHMWFDKPMRFGKGVFSTLLYVLILIVILIILTLLH